MSRIDEALRQAGLRSQPQAHPVAGLDSFPVGADQEAVESAADLSEPARTPAPAWEPPQRAAVPQSGLSTHSGRGLASLAAEKLVIHEQTSRACVEQYRRVAAMLHQLQEERGTKVLMVASAQPAEGKTLTAANLALTLSESYRRRVLLIDADLRRPSLTALFHLQTLSGLSEQLKNDTSGPLRVLALSERLALLPGGRPDQDPMAGLTSGRLQTIVQQAAADYDWVILDTPPAALQPDAHLISTAVEAVVFVIGAGRSQASAVQSAIDTIGRDKIIGVILNRIDSNAFSNAAYYDYYYQAPREGAGPRSSKAMAGH